MDILNPDTEQLINLLASNIGVEMYGTTYNPARLTTQLIKTKTENSTAVTYFSPFNFTYSLLSNFSKF